MNINVTKDEIKKDPLDTTIIHKGEYHINPLNFFFSEEYDGLNKKAIFEDDNNKVEVEIVNNSCNIPSIILNSKSNYFNLRVYGYRIIDGQVDYRYSPTYATIPLYEGSYISNVTVLESGNGGSANIQTLKVLPDITSNGYIAVLPDSGYDAIAEVDFNVDVPSVVNNENQSVNIISNGVYTYTPDEGYTGIGSIEVDVAVPTGGSGIDLSSGIKFAYSNFASIPYDILSANWEDITEMDNMFDYNMNITTVPTIGTTSIISMQYTFANCYNLVTVNSNNTANVIFMSGMFENDNLLEDIPQLDTSSCINMQNIVTNCPSLTNASLDNLLAMCANVNASYNRPKALKDLGLDDTQILTCQSLTNYQDALDAGWTDYPELTVDVDLSAIRLMPTTYTVPTIGAFDGYLWESGVEVTLNDSTLQEQVVGTLNGNHFDSSDNTLSFDISYNGLEEGNEYFFENISYTPNP